MSTPLSMRCVRTSEAIFVPITYKGGATDYKGGATDYKGWATDYKGGATDYKGGATDRDARGARVLAQPCRAVRVPPRVQHSLGAPAVHLRDHVHTHRAAVTAHGSVLVQKATSHQVVQQRVQLLVACEDGFGRISGPLSSCRDPQPALNFKTALAAAIE